MLKKISAWFAPPTLQGNEEQVMQARLLDRNLIAIGAYLLAMVLFYGFGAPIPAEVALFNAILLGVILLLRRWLFQGRLMAAGIGLLVAGFITITLVVASMGTVASPAAILYVLIVILAGVLQRMRGVIAASAASSLAILGIILAQNGGMLPPPPRIALVPQWLTYTVAFLVSGSMIHYAMQTMRAALIAKNKENEERQQAAQALRASEEKFSKAFMDSPDSIIISAMEDGRYLEVNDSFLRNTGYIRAEAIGRTAIELGVWPWLSDHDEIVAQLNQQGSVRDQEMQYRRKSGEIRDGQLSMEVIELENGKKCVLTVMRDITEVKESRQKLEDLNRELELRVRERTAELSESRDALSAANQALEKGAKLKDEFLASMSHELRTPLTTILGLSEVLQFETYGTLNEKQLKAVENISTAGQHLLELINDVLDLSKIEADRLQLNLEPCALLDVCMSSLQLVKGMARQKNQQVQFCASLPGAVVQADPRRLKQMLVNLLSNAIKFTPAAGELGLEVSASPDEGSIYLAVWDKGIGIKSEDLEKLFKPYSQIDSSLSRQTTGTGLGLVLVANLARLHGGSVSVQSTLGQGSRFTIALPWKTQAPGQPG